MGPIFEHMDIGTPIDDAFNGAFINQQSYVELLRIADSFYGLNMTSKDRKLPCQLNSYLLLSRKQDKVWKGINRNVSLNVVAISYNEKYGILAAIVQLKNNFTCNQIPHIVLAKNQGINNVLVSRILLQPDTKTTPLYTAHKVHGKIGVIINSGEETMNMGTKLVNGIATQSTQDVVTRPEVVYAVQHPLPVKQSKNKFKSMEQLQDEVMEIKVEGGDTATGETYQGEPVMKGPKGGKFIMKDGKKKYVPKNKSGDSDSDVVYSVNILE